MSGVRRQLLTWAAYSLGLLLVSSACGYLVRAMNPRPEPYPSYPTYYAPQPAARYDLVNRPAPAFGRAMPPTPADVAEFVPVFDALAAAARSGNGNGYAALWDCDRTAEEVWALAARWSGTVPTDQQVRTTARELREATARQGRDRGGPYRFDRTELLKVARSRDGREALVVARHTATEDGAPTVHGVRWWLARAPGGWWQVYDRAAPRGRMRETVRLAGYAWNNPFAGFAPVDPESGPARGIRLPMPIESVEHALAQPLDGSTFELERALANCRQTNFPPPWTAARAVAEANLRVQEGEPRKALPLLDEAARLDPTFPLTHLVRAVAANRLGDYKTVIRSVSLYRDAVGPDPDANLQIGLALEATQRSAPAAREYRTALKDCPGHDALYPALARALPAGRKREAGELAAKGPRPAEHLDAILLAPEAGGVALADEVVAGFLAVRPDDPHGLMAAAVVRVRQRNVPEAAALLREAREATAEGEREEMWAAYLGEVLRHGVPVAGYNAVPPADRRAAFRTLATDLLNRMVGVDSPAAGPVKELVAAHRATDPADPWWEFYAAVSFAEGGRLERAEELLAAAMARLPKPTLTTRRKSYSGTPLATDITEDEWVWDEFRARRVEYLVKLGRWRDAYRELPPAAHTFDQLAFELDGAGDVAGLKELMAMHEKVVPGDVEAIYWQAQVHWSRQQTREAVELFEEYAQKAAQAPGDSHPALAQQMAFRTDENRVRGLVRLGRIEEARAVLEGSKMVSAMWSLQAVVAAASGDADRLGQVLAKWAATHDGWAEFYADPDLGPLLREGPFPELRAKYPPP
jgi:tetratricopeptide (TPR) repeat protein